MKDRLSSWLYGAAAVVLAVAGFANLAAAQQTDSPYIVFAKAGRVNYVTGAVTRQRADADLRETLQARDNLAAGELVRTGAFGRIEVLLTPGAFWRVNTTSEFALLNTELDSLRVRLNKGSAALEALGPDDYKIQMVVETPQTTITIAKRGIYRFNVTPTETTVAVQKGRALVGAEGLIVKGDNQATVSSNAAPVLAKYTKKMRDDFDEWGKERSAVLALANQRINDRGLLAALGNSAYNASSSRGYGLWFYDRLTGLYTFLPFGVSGWGSPYGWSYYNGLNYNGFLDYCGCRYGGGIGGGGSTGGTPTPTAVGRTGTVIVAAGQENREAPDGPLVGGRGTPSKSLLVTRDVTSDSNFGRDDNFGRFPDNSTPTRSVPDSGSKSVYTPPPAAPSGSVETDSAGGGAVKKP